MYLNVNFVKNLKTFLQINEKPVELILAHSMYLRGKAYIKIFLKYSLILLILKNAEQCNN